MKGNLSSAQGLDQAIWLVGWMAGWAFLCCCHNGIITPWDKSLAVEKWDVESLKPDASVWIKLSSTSLTSVLLFFQSFPVGILLPSAHTMDHNHLDTTV